MRGFISGEENEAWLILEAGGGGAGRRTRSGTPVPLAAAPTTADVLLIPRSRRPPHLKKHEPGRSGRDIRERTHHAFRSAAGLYLKVERAWHKANK